MMYQYNLRLTDESKDSSIENCHLNSEMYCLRREVCKQDWHLATFAEVRKIYYSQS
jgi:hypothetical protein